MDEILKQIATCVERGKVDRDAPYPPDMRNEPGASEWTRKALDEGVPAARILAEGLVTGMHAVGERFSQGQAFIPDLLISAKAMTAAMDHLKASFESGEVSHQGTFIIGTVSGDLHDIGKKIVGMVMQGNGWNVVDLGTDVATPAFLDSVRAHGACVVGLSALLTTTMPAMENTVKAIKAEFPDVPIFVGGAPITAEFATRIGADGYYPDPQGLAGHFA